jgi:PQQ-like domain
MRRPLRETRRRRAPGRGLLAGVLLLTALQPGCADSQSVLAPHTSTGQDWTRFGWDAERSSAPTAASGITKDNVTSLVRQQVTLDGTVDASAIYLHGVEVNGAPHDVFFVTTSYGKTLAIDADSGTVLWRYTPTGYDSWAGSYQITTATPVADPDRSAVYAASPDGHIQKLAVADGHVVWTTAITMLPAREKIAASLNYFNGRVIATTGGYIGDAPPYQGHVAILDGATGTLLHVWNSLCSDQTGLLDPASCPESDSAIWGRAGAVIDTTSGDIFVATGNGLWDGGTNWGDAALELNPDATAMLGNYTPTNTAQLNASDADLGSTSPVLLGGGLVVQGGKDGSMRLLDWSKLGGTAPHKDSERQIVSTPSGTDLFTAPAVWHSGTETRLFAADNGGTTAWTLRGDTLQQAWHNGTGGTSPLVADGLLYVYDPGGGLHVYDATSGTELTTLACGGGHWNSPIVVDGRVALPEGNANSHSTHGVLDIWRPAQ